MIYRFFIANSGGMKDASARREAPRGVALIFAVIFTAVVLSIGLSLADISYKQIILASAAKQSEYAFYNADSALECILEMDQQQQYNTFLLSNAGSIALPSLTCEGVSPTLTAQSGTANVSLTATISIPCQSGGSNATVTIIKSSLPASDGYHTHIYADGFNDCSVSDPARVERGIIAKY